MDEPEYDSLKAGGRTALASQNMREFAERCGLVATLLWHWHCHRCRSRATGTGCQLPAITWNCMCTKERLPSVCSSR